MTAEDSGPLVERWRNGDQQAAAELFERYTRRLIALARSRLSEKFAGRLDPEDVVQSVYRSFFAEARDGRFQCECGRDLWQLLVTITLHKLQDQVKWHQRGKRAVEREQNFASEDSLVAMQSQAIAEEPSPVEALALIDEMEQFMRRLQPLEQRLLELRLNGQNVKQIAQELRIGVRTVYRLLEQLRSQLQQWHRGDV